MGTTPSILIVSSGWSGSMEYTNVPKPELPQALKDVPAASGGFLKSSGLCKPGCGLYLKTTSRLSLASQARESGSQGKSASSWREWVVADHLYTLFIRCSAK